MSLNTLSRVWDESKQSGTGLLVLLAIADRADELGVAWPGTNWLAQRARLSRRQLIRWIQTLEEAAEIEVVRSKKHPTHNVVNHYIVAVGADENLLLRAQARVADLLKLRSSVADDTSDTGDTTSRDVTSVMDDTRVVTSEVKSSVVDVTRSGSDPSSYPFEKAEFWDSALEMLRGQMTSGMFEKLFCGTKAHMDGEQLVIGLRNKSALEWLSSGRLDRAVVSAVADAAGSPLDFRFEVVQQELVK